jgi:hypothetical protein
VVGSVAAAAAAAGLAVDAPGAGGFAAVAVVAPIVLVIGAPLALEHATAASTRAVIESVGTNRNVVSPESSPAGRSAPADSPRAAPLSLLADPGARGSNCGHGG